MIKHYKNAAFTLLISIFMINILISLLITSVYGFSNKNTDNAVGINHTIGVKDYSVLINVLSVISAFLLISGIFFTVKSILKKEKKDYKFIISLAGYAFLVLMNVMMMF